MKQLAVIKERSSANTAKLKLKKQEQSFNRVSKVKTIQVKQRTHSVASHKNKGETVKQPPPSHSKFNSPARAYAVLDSDLHSPP